MTRVKKKNRALIFLLAAGLGLATAPGCDRYARHAVLTFFFTGVPPLGEEKKPAQKSVKAVEAAKERKMRVTFKATVFSHGPFASGECDQCHETSETAGFRGMGTNETAPETKKASVTGRLVSPLQELCSTCHTSKSAKHAHKEGLRMHGPVGSGNCTFCHSPHSSPQQYALLKKPDELCVQCHPERLLFNRKAHIGYRDCLSCHNAHLGKSSLLLKNDYHEVM